MQRNKKTKQITVIVGLVVRNGKILMVRRFEPEVKGAHLKWEFPGGKVEFGETPEEALVREIKEETGVHAKIKRLLNCVVTTNWQYPWGIQQTLIFGFECEYVKEAGSYSDHHVKETKWTTCEEALRMDTLPGAEPFIKALTS